MTFFYFKYTKSDIFCELIFSRSLFVLTSEDWRKDASPISLLLFPLKFVHCLYFGFVWYTDSHNRVEVTDSVQALSYYHSNYKWIENLFANIKDRPSHLSKKWVRADSSGSPDSLWWISISNEQVHMCTVYNKLDNLLLDSWKTLAFSQMVLYHLLHHR